MEATVWELMNSGIAVELIVTSPKDEITAVGIRLRTYGKLLPKDKMILSAGETFEEALEAAVEKAKGGHWEHLNWAARPWTVGTSAASRVAAAYGLV